MRNIFIKKLFKRAKKNKDVILLTGDLGYKVFDDFKTALPNQFFNVGIAENNMVNIAVGLALNKKEVYIYSILPFLSFKSIEQIRNNILNLNLNIKLIGAGGGFSYNNQGISHNTSEDVNVLRSFPNLHIFNPGFDVEAEKTIDFIFKSKNPSFVRLGKSISLQNSFYNLDVSKGSIIKKGQDLCILTSGNIIENILIAIGKTEGVSIQLVSITRLKPLSKIHIKNILSKFDKILVIEEFSFIGGLKTILLESLGEDFFKNKKIYNISLSDKPHTEIGSTSYLRSINNLSPKKIKNKIISIFN